jgi:hypothetical protein
VSPRLDTIIVSMEKFSPDRYIQYKLATARRNIRLAARGEKKARHEVAKLARNTVIFASAVTAAATAGYDHRAHANGEKGLTQGYAWVSVPLNDCVGVGLVATHAVQPAEEVSIHIVSTDSTGQKQDVAVNLSGDPLVGAWTRVCSEPAEAGLQIDMHAENGGVQGKSELVYAYPGAKTSE